MRLCKAFTRRFRPAAELRKPMKKNGFKTMFSYREKLPVKTHGFKTMVFMGIFEEALNGLTRPLRAL